MRHTHTRRRCLMSTRSQLRFIQRSETADEQSKTDAHRVTQIYRHSGGYPDSVLAISSS